MRILTKGHPVSEAITLQQSTFVKYNSMLREFALVFSEYYAMLCYIIFARYEMQIFQELCLRKNTVNPRSRVQCTEGNPLTVTTSLTIPPISDDHTFLTLT